MNETDQLVAYLATHDAPCPGCYRNLRGQGGPICPACETNLRLSEVRVWHEAHGDAIGNPIPRGTPEERASLAAYLRVSDAKCTECGYSLRKLSSNRCPECRALLIETEIRYRDEVKRDGWATNTRRQFPAQERSIVIPVIFVIMFVILALVMI